MNNDCCVGGVKVESSTYEKCECTRDRDGFLEGTTFTVFELPCICMGGDRSWKEVHNGIEMMGSKRKN